MNNKIRNNEGKIKTKRLVGAINYKVYYNGDFTRTKKDRTDKLCEGNITKISLNLKRSLNPMYSERLHSPKQDKLKEINL